MVRHLLCSDDLSEAEVALVLNRAAALAGGTRARRRAPPFVVGTMFLSSSMRTRVGFCVAACRLGGAWVEASELRFGPNMSAAESFEDALRVVSGMVDVVVVRTSLSLDRERVVNVAKCPVINAGDGGSRGEHPSQALIDVAAMIRFRGPLAGLHIGICGDLSMRAVRSLLYLLERQPPGTLTLVAPPGRRAEPSDVGPTLAPRTRYADAPDMRAIDVLYLPGLPMGTGADRLGESDRSTYALTGEQLTALRADAIVLSPLPVIDEIDAVARADPRVRMFDQSDHAVFIRMALLEFLLDQ